MRYQLRILNALLRFFISLKKRLEEVIHELKFMKYELEFGERDDDIYVASFLKSGTTWMQMILYQLTTNGETDFNHIYDVSPWPRQHANRNEAVPQLPSPRIIKTHDPYFKIPKGKKGRFIYLIRDGRDVAVSLWHHRLNYNNRHLSFDENFKQSFMEAGRMNWFEHVGQWLQNSNKHTVLYVRYEDLQKQFERELFRIASFIGVKISHDQMPRILERSSFAFMKQHQEKFGEQPTAEKHEIVYDQFLRSGKVGEGVAQLSVEQQQFFAQQMQQCFSRSQVMAPYVVLSSAT